MFQVDTIRIDGWQFSESVAEERQRERDRERERERVRDIQSLLIILVLQIAGKIRIFWTPKSVLLKYLKLSGSCDVRPPERCGDLIVLAPSGSALSTGLVSRFMARL